MTEDRAISLNVIKKWLNDNGIYGYDKQIEQLPPVTPQRPTGHWIEHLHQSGETWDCECSKCGVLTEDDSNYCPNCGADMRGNDNESGN